MTNLSINEKKEVAHTLNSCEDLSYLSESLDIIASKKEYHDVAKNLVQYSRLHDKKEKLEFLTPAEKKEKLFLKENIEKSIKEISSLEEYSA